MKFGGTRRFFANLNSTFDTFPDLVKDLVVFVPSVFFPVVILLLIGTNIGFHFFVNSSELKNNVRVSYYNFDNYSKSVESITNHLLDKEGESRFDSDSFERESKKGSSLLELHDKHHKGMDMFFKATGASKVKEYSSFLTSYLAISDELIKMERDAVKLYSAYVLPLRLNEELAIKLAGERFYMYTSSDRYMKSLEEAINNKKTIVKSMESLSLDNEMHEINQIVIKKINSEIQYLEDMKESAKTLSDDAVSLAELKYKRSQQEIVKEFNAKNDEIEVKISAKIDALNLKRTKVNEAFAKL